MNQDTIKGIVQRCTAIDDLAASVYLQLSRTARGDDGKDFWLKILDESRLRSAYWEKLGDWAGRGILPQFFDVPDNVLGELATIEQKIRSLVGNCDPAENFRQALLIAFKLEFYLLHPAFECFFQYLQTVNGSSSAVDAHGAINSLFEALEEYGLESLELELLGESLRRLWQENRKMAVQSNTDALTGVLNRRGFFNAIKPLAHLAQRNVSAVGIMMADIDYFKKINDRFGHQFGDDVLRYVAQTLQGNIRASDLIGRYGGEEFVLFLSPMSEDALILVAEKLRSAVAAGNGDYGSVTVSIGAVYCLVDFPVETQMEKMIQAADRHLLKAKRGGRNRTVA